VGEICCLNPLSNNPPDHCAQPNMCGNAFVELLCSGPADCPGELCCAHGMVVNQQGQPLFRYSGTSCQPTCPYTIPESEFPLCDPTGPNVCGVRTCQQSMELGNNYFVCKAFNVIALTIPFFSAPP
jgi:hypothetical protein